MITITVTGTSGSLVASASDYTAQFEELSPIAMQNQTGVDISVCQCVQQSDISLSPGPPAYGYFQLVQGNTNIQLDFTPGYNKVYLGFLAGDPTEPAMVALFANALASNDAWFLTPPSQSPIAPIRVRGCVEAVLTPQTDPNPPHNVHPKITTTVNFWDSNNALIWIMNNAGRDAIFYLELFRNPQSPLPSTSFSEWPVGAGLSSFVFPFGQGYSDNANAWYGCAFSGEYANAQEYFAAHPAGQGHHTQEIPPVT